MPLMSLPSCPCVSLSFVRVPVSIKELAQYDPKAGLVTHHAISPYHCRPFTCPSTKQPSPYLSAGVITALFDEVTHTHRGTNHRGLSIHIYPHTGAYGVLQRVPLV